jgi:DNA-binding transcriptional regulator/RsmH inhibitor MraZ
MFFGMARLVKPDAQGRIVLPEASMEQALVAENVVLVGSDDHIEIWPRDDWKRHVQEMMPSYGEMLYEAADRLSAERAGPEQERK